MRLYVGIHIGGQKADSQEGDTNLPPNSEPRSSYVGVYKMYRDLYSDNQKKCGRRKGELFQILTDSF